MTITKCDICGKETKPINVSRMKIYLARAVMVSNYDMCPKCTTELAEWMKNKNKQEAEK